MNTTRGLEERFYKFMAKTFPFYIYRYIEFMNRKYYQWKMRVCVQFQIKRISKIQQTSLENIHFAFPYKSNLLTKKSDIQKKPIDIKILSTSINK